MMIEITWRYDPEASTVEHQPDTAAAARIALDTGNAAFVSLGSAGPHVIPVHAADLGIGAELGVAPAQVPFAAFLGCADARVPLELVFSQAANDLFAVRVAGNVLGSECVGSLDYAVAHLPSVRLLAVIGHTGCGAVGAATDAYLQPSTYMATSANLPLRSIVDAVMTAVRGADVALRARYGNAVAEQPGYRLALIDTAVVLNAAVAADAIGRLFATRLGDTLGVAFGVFDLASRQVGLPTGTADQPWRAGLVDPPTAGSMPAFGAEIVGSAHIQRLLTTHPAGGH